MTSHHGRDIKIYGGPDRPSLFDLFLLGCPLEIALDILAGWDSLPEQERAALGFPAQRQGGPLH